MPINQSGLSVNVKVNLANNRIVSSSTSQVKTLKTQFNSVDAVSELTDVVVNAPQDGFTLVYDSVLGKYVVQKLTSEDINISSLDGGTF